MLILGIILFGLLAGWVAQLIMGRRGNEIDWTMALIAGLAGSFVGGLVLSLVFGDGLSLEPSGIIGSILGALIVSFLWATFGGRGKAATSAGKKSAKR
jgi:uncharacterized membrane protein YeaQ/YmgE (transglycosylase-associated protein family)